MYLSAFYYVFPVAYTHYLAFFCASGYLEARGKLFAPNNQGMISAGDEWVVDITVYSLTIMIYKGCFAVDGDQSTAD